MRLILGFAIGLVCVPVMGLAQTGDGLYGNTFTITDLGHGVHTLTWNPRPGSFAIGNSTFVVGDSDVIVVDTGFSRSTGRAILEGLRTVTDKPVSMVINTHWHGDHIFGNQVFRHAFPTARFVAHPATRDGILVGEVGYRDVNRPKVQARIGELTSKTQRTAAEDQELRRAEMQLEAWQGDYVLPDILVEQALSIIQGNRQVHVVHLGEANTKGDLVVHLPGERILITGDMAITPMQFAFFSSPRKWIDTLGRLAGIDAAVIVPGHGPVQRDRRFLADLQSMLRSVVDQVDAGVTAGLALEQLQKTVTVVPPPGSVYEKASVAALDRLFRLPAIESAVKEKGLAQAQTPQQVAEELLAADRAFSTASATTNLIAGLSAMFAPEVVMAAPVGLVYGYDKAVDALRSNPANATANAVWTPARVGLSSDGQHGYTAGFMAINRADGSVQHVKYMTYWEKRSTGWRALAYKRAPANVAAPPTPVGRVLPTQIAAAAPDVATMERYRESLADAERSFSKDAQTMGIGAAFKQYGSPDAANFGSPDIPTFVFGNEAIGAQVGAGAPPNTSSVHWGPETTIVAASGDFGVTLGYIHRNTPAADGTVAPGQPFFTIWRRESLTAPWRYIAE